MAKPRQSAMGLMSVGSHTRWVWSPLSYTFSSMLTSFSYVMRDVHENHFMFGSGFGALGRRLQINASIEASPVGWASGGFGSGIGGSPTMGGTWAGPRFCNL